jgi:hypothetical protein
MTNGPSVDATHERVLAFVDSIPDWHRNHRCMCSRNCRIRAVMDYIAVSIVQSDAKQCFHTTVHACCVVP